MAGSSFSQSTSTTRGQSTSDTYIPEYSQTPILNEIAQHARAMSDVVYNQGLDIYNKNQGNIDGVMRDALSYASPQRIAVDMGMAEAGVQQAGERGRLSAERDLESYGIDPSSGRYAALDASNRVMTAAAAGAGNQQRMADQAAGNAMRQQAISASLQNANVMSGVNKDANAFLSTASQLKYPPLGRTSQSTNATDSQSTSGSVQTDPSGGGGKGGGGEKQPSQGGGGQPKGGGGSKEPGPGRAPAAPKPTKPEPTRDPAPKPTPKGPGEDEEVPVPKPDPRGPGKGDEPPEPIPGDPNVSPEVTTPYRDDTPNTDTTFDPNPQPAPNTDDTFDPNPQPAPNTDTTFNPNPPPPIGDIPSEVPYGEPPAETMVENYDPYADNTQTAAFQQPQNIDPVTGQPIEADEGESTAYDPAGSLYGLGETGGWTEGDVTPAGYSQDDQTAMWSDIGQGTMEGNDPGYQEPTYEDPGTIDYGDQDYGDYDFGDTGEQDYGDYQDQYADYGDEDYYNDFEDDYGDDQSYDDYGDDYGDDYADDSYDDQYDFGDEDYGDDSYDDYADDSYDYTDDSYQDAGDYEYDDSGGESYDEGARGGAVMRGPRRGRKRRARIMPPRRPRPRSGYMRGGPIPQQAGMRLDAPPKPPGAALRAPQPQQAPRPARGAPMAAPGGPRPGPMGRGPRPMPGNMISANGMPPPTGMPQRMAGGGQAGRRAEPTTGGFVSRSLSPSGGSTTDDVDARLNAGEFVIPKDVSAWKGKEFFYKLIAQARKNRAGGDKPQKPQMGYSGGRDTQR